MHHNKFEELLAEVGLAPISTGSTPYNLTGPYKMPEYVLYHYFLQLQTGRGILRWDVRNGMTINPLVIFSNGSRPVSSIERGLEVILVDSNFSFEAEGLLLIMTLDVANGKWRHFVACGTQGKYHDGYSYDPVVTNLLVDYARGNESVAGIILDRLQDGPGIVGETLSHFFQYEGVYGGANAEDNSRC